MKKLLTTLGMNDSFLTLLESLSQKEQLEDDDRDMLQKGFDEFIELKVAPKFRDLQSDAIKRAKDETFGSIVESMKTQARRLADFDGEELKGNMKHSDVMDLLASKLQARTKETDTLEVKKAKEQILGLQTKNQELKSKYDDFESNFEKYKEDIRSEYALKEHNRKVDTLLLKKVNNKEIFTPVDNLPSAQYEFQKDGIITWVKTNCSIGEDASIMSKDGATKVQSPCGNYIWENLDQAIKGYSDFRKISKKSHTAKTTDSSGTVLKTTLRNKSGEDKEIDLTAINDLYAEAEKAFK